jgi:hypothetical protein
MREIAEMLVPWAVVTLALFALFDWDESRLTAERLERAWPPATKTLAIVYFGALGVPVLVHFWRTRRSVSGVLVGVVGGVLAFALNVTVAVAIDALPDEALSPGPALAAMALIGIAFAAGLVGLSSRARLRKAR